MSTFSQKQAATRPEKPMFSKETWQIDECRAGLAGAGLAGAGLAGAGPAGAGPAGAVWRGPVQWGPVQWGLAAAQPRIARANASPRSR